MITFNDQDLFSTGPASIDPGPYTSRDAVANAPDSIGASVIRQGTSPRTIKQRGTLVADSAEDLHQLIEVIQANIGASSATLIDQHGGAWPDCVMRRIETQRFQRLGPRYATQYEITYVQARP